MDVAARDRVEPRSRYWVLVLATGLAVAFVAIGLVGIVAIPWSDPTTHGPWIVGFAAAAGFAARLAFQTWRGDYKPDYPPDRLGGF
jgi:purine-cytosine permease-like protein